MDADAHLSSFLTAFQRLAEAAQRAHGADGGPTLTDALTDHLGMSPRRVAVVSKEVAAHRFPDYDVTLEAMAGPDATSIGLGGGDQRHHMSLADMVSATWQGFGVRVDLSVEIPLPDEAGRRRLLGLYGRAAGFGDPVLDDVARRSDARTASFFKELVRRAVLYAAEAGTEPADEHLLAAFDALQSDRTALERRA